MGINFSDSIARLRLQHASLNSKNINAASPKNSEADNLPLNGENLSAEDSFSHSSSDTENKHPAPVESEQVSVMHYKNAARAAAAMSQYGINSGNAFLLKQMTSFPDKNSS